MWAAVMGDDYRHEQLPRITAADLPGGGVACPNCGCTHFITANTEKPVQGLIRRRKICRHCGRRIVTHEELRS
jgi:hypothetical protein